MTQFERVLYSAPFALVGKTLSLRATDAAVALFEDCRHVATHPRGQRPGQRVSVRSLGFRSPAQHRRRLGIAA